MYFLITELIISKFMYNFSMGGGGGKRRGGKVLEIKERKKTLIPIKGTNYSNNGFDFFIFLNLNTKNYLEGGQFKTAPL